MPWRKSSENFHFVKDFQLILKELKDISILVLFISSFLYLMSSLYSF